MHAALHKIFPQWFRSMLEPLKKYFREIFAISLFTNLLALSVPLFTLQVYDRVVAHNAVSTLVALAIGVTLALSFDFLLRQTRSRLLQHVSLQIDGVLGRKLYEKFASLPLQVLEAKPTSFWQARFADITSIRNVCSGPMAVLFSDLPFALVFLLVIAVVATPIVWVLLFFIGLFAALTYASTQALNVANAKEIRKNQSRDVVLAELLAARTTVKALMIDRSMRNHFEDLHAGQIQEAYKRGASTDSYLAIGYSLSFFCTAALILAGAVAIMDRDLTAGALVATTMLSSRIISPVNQLLSSWKQVAAARQAILHLDALFVLESEREAVAVGREAPKGAFAVEKVTFGYAADRPPVIKELSLAIQPGEMIGIVGRNGCGKTTLLKLLQGLYTPMEGRITLDGADISQFTRAEMTQWIGYVPQECILFSGTIRENIAKAYPEATDEEVLRAAKMAGADQFVIDLPDGYHTQVGEGGSKLSGGQRQRIAIARALLRNPPILIFDEVSSNLDSGAEIALRQQLLSLAGSHTILLCSHSSILLGACQRMMVMERGQLVMMGPTAQVLATLAGNVKAPAPTTPKEAQA